MARSAYRLCSNVLSVRHSPAIVHRKLPGPGCQPADEDLGHVRNRWSGVNPDHLCAGTQAARFNVFNVRGVWGATRSIARLFSPNGWAYPWRVARVLPHDSFDAADGQLFAGVAHCFARILQVTEGGQGR